MVIPESTDAQLLVHTLQEHSCTSFLSDMHMVKALHAAGLSMPAGSNVRGAVKIGGGQAFGLGTAVEWGGIHLTTVGKP